MHTVRLLLNATEYDKQIIDKRFRALSRIHNVLVSHAKKRLSCLSRHFEYQDLKSEYAALLKKGKFYGAYRTGIPHTGWDPESKIRD